MVEEVSSRMIHSIYCKNFCKSHNVLPPSPTIKKEKKGALLKQNLLGDQILLSVGRKPVVLIRKSSQRTNSLLRQLISLLGN
jgi:hypothetical protein